MRFYMLRNWSILYHDVIDSTNSEARRIIEGDNNNAVSLHKAVIHADGQTDGRGRSGNKWVSSQGNLLLSLVLIEEGKTLTELSQLSFVAAVALRQAIIQIYGKEIQELQYKWPNDLLFSGKKVAGLLLESLSLPEGRHAIILGIGVNVATYPELSSFQKATSLKNALDSFDFTPRELLSVLLEVFDRLYQQWGRGSFDKVIKAWKKDAFGFEKEVSVRLPKEQFTGILKGIDDEGVLSVSLENGKIRKVTSGEIFFI